MMNKFVSIVASVIFLTFTTGTAFASDWYVTGQANRTFDSGLTASIDSYGSASTDLNDTTGAGIGVGYDVNPWLAFEVTYEDFGSGSKSKDFSVYGYPTMGKLNYDFESAGAWVVVDPTIATIGSMPLKLVARIGVTQTRGRLDAKTMTPFGHHGAVLNTSSSANVSDTSVGLGAGFALGVMPNLDILVEYRYRDLNDTTNVKTDVDVSGYYLGTANTDVNFATEIKTVSLGVKYTF